MAQLATMHMKVSRTMVQPEACYKRYFERKVRSLPSFKVGQMVYVNRSPLIIFAANRQSSAKYNKLRPRTTGTFKVLEVRGNIPKIDKFASQIPFYQ